MNNVKFNVKAQKEHLARLGDILEDYEACEYAYKSNPEYWDLKMEAVVLMYASTLSELARSVFNDPINKHLPTQLLGDLTT